MPAVHTSLSAPPEKWFSEVRGRDKLNSTGLDNRVNTFACRKSANKCVIACVLCVVLNKRVETRNIKHARIACCLAPDVVADQYA